MRGAPAVGLTTLPEDSSGAVWDALRLATAITRRASCSRVHRWLGHSKRRFVTRAVPDVENLDTEGLLADVVENAVRTKDDLTQCSSRPGRIGPDRWGQ